MAAENSKPAILFVPGMASVGTVVYKPLCDTLVDLGFPADQLHTINHISVVEDLSNPPQLDGNALQKDTEQLRGVLENLVENEHRDVLLVAHSYGATPSLYAATGLWQHQRATSGKRGGVIRAALIASSLTLPGGTIGGERAEWLKANNLPADEGAKIEMVGNDAYLIPTGLEIIWMNDITDSAMRTSLRPAALSTVFSPTPADEPELPKSWRISYLILAELDLGQPEAFQRYLIGRAREAGAEVTEQTLRSGHFAQVSHAREVAQWLLGLV